MSGFSVAVRYIMRSFGRNVRSSRRHGSREDAEGCFPAAAISHDIDLGMRWRRILAFLNWGAFAIQDVNRKVDAPALWLRTKARPTSTTSRLFARKPRPRPARHEPMSANFRSFVATADCLRWRPA